MRPTGSAMGGSIEPADTGETTTESGPGSAARLSGVRTGEEAGQPDGAEICVLLALPRGEPSGPEGSRDAVPSDLSEGELANELALIRSGRSPLPEDLAAAPYLSSWALIGTAAPRLVGCVTGHPRIFDGWMITSPVVWMAPDRRAARTASRFYRLGDAMLGTPLVQTIAEGASHSQPGADHPCAAWRSDTNTQ